MSGVSNAAGKIWCMGFAVDNEVIWSREGNAGLCEWLRRDE